MSVELNVGDIVVDLITGMAAVLVTRYLLSNHGHNDPLALWVWDVYWVGKDIKEESRIQTWTECGLVNIIKTRTFIHYKCI